MPTAGSRPGDPRVSILICTRDRAASLARALSGLSAMRPVACPWEVLVVDNGSRDETAQVVAGFAGRLPLRRIAEPRPGLSHARNAGVAAACGDYLLWTDDDVRVDAEWLAAYVAAFARWPGVAVFGGRALPEFDAPRVPWMVDGVDALRDLLAVRDFGRDPIPLGGAVMPYGLNYAVRRREQRLHLYDPALGVAPGRRIGGEETAVIGAILAAGGTGVWLPDAQVFHQISPERQTRDYVRHYYEARGRMIARSLWPDRGPAACGISPWRIGRAAAALARYRLTAALPGRFWLPPLIGWSVQKGWIAEAKSLRRREADRAATRPPHPAERRTACPRPA